LATSRRPARFESVSALPPREPAERGPVPQRLLRGPQRLAYPPLRPKPVRREAAHGADALTPLRRNANCRKAHLVVCIAGEDSSGLREDGLKRLRADTVRPHRGSVGNV